jgi:hypothetical protein
VSPIRTCRGAKEKEFAASRDAALAAGLQADFQVRQPAISSLVGKRPVAFFENAKRPSTRISKTPPLDRRRFICAEGRSLVISFPASRARGS